MMDHWLTDTAGIHASISDIPFQMDPSPITLEQFILSFMLFVLSTQEVKFWPNHQAYLVLETTGRPVFHQNSLIHKDVPYFNSLILSNTFLCNFLPVF